MHTHHADILIQNIKGLVQARVKPCAFVAGTDMAALPVISNAFLSIEGGRIKNFGSMENLPAIEAVRQIDASGCYVFPSFIDSHTHLVYAASREAEFVMKIKGSSYEAIAANGGGILNSVKELQNTSEDDLLIKTKQRAHEIIKLGTGAVEIKSGYGLTVHDELKMLRVARRLPLETALTVKTTFLGAHAVPAGQKKQDYIRLVIDEMIPAIAAEKLADYIDVFCEQGFFTVDEALRILEEGKRHGMKPRLHANQLSRSGGVQLGVKVSAVSVDHLENIAAEEITALKGSTVMPTALPCAAFFLGLPFPPAREMIDQGLPLALASDFNPGSAPSGSMPLVISMACIKMKMTPEEAINATTINTAYALELQDVLGSIAVGKKANLFITKPMPSVSYFPYAFGSNLIDTVILNGKEITC